MKMENENIVKHTAKELGLTYKELGEAIGYGEGAIKQAATGEISRPMKKAIELLRENMALRLEIKQVKEFKAALREMMQ
jgi:transcriptional regulator with XRE-family HTH domain